MPDTDDRPSDVAGGLRQAGESQNAATVPAGCPACGDAWRIRWAELLPAWFPDPREEPTVPLWPIAGRLLGRRRSAILELARRDQLPFRVLRVGRSYRVATVELLRLLGLEPTEGDLEKDEQDRL
jgi:hypothetical protein